MGSEKSLVIAVIGILVISFSIMIVLKGVNSSTGTTEGLAARASPGKCSIMCADGSHCDCTPPAGGTASCTCDGLSNGELVQAICECGKGARRV